MTPVLIIAELISDRPIELDHVSIVQRTLSRKHCFLVRHIDVCFGTSQLAPCAIGVSHLGGD